MVLPLRTTLVMSQFFFILHLKNIHTDFFTLNVIECIAHRGVPRIWEGGGPRIFFFRFGNLHVAKRHGAHGEAMRIARGVWGHAPPRKFFKTVQFGAF